MTIHTQCAERKEMVKAISEHLGIPSRYLFAPSCAYQVGDFTIHRDCTISYPDEHAREAIDLVSFLKAEGYITEDTSTMTFPNEEPAATEVPADSEAEEATDEVDAIQVIVHNHGLDATGAANLLRTVYSRQTLLRKMLKSECIHVDDELSTRLHDEHPDTLAGVIRILNECKAIGMAQGIDLTEEDFTLTVTPDPEMPTRWQFGSMLMNAMVEKAKVAKRVNMETQIPAEDEMKYFARSWLIQLGLGGTSYSPMRHALLDHLKGYAAFRQGEKMTAHNKKHAELRRQKKAQAAAIEEVNTHE